MWDFSECVIVIVIHCHFLHHVTHDAWIQYIVMLFSLGGKGSQVGIFKGKLIDGTSISLDWVLGWVYMVLLIIMVFLKWFFYVRRRRTSSDSDDLQTKYEVVHFVLRGIRDTSFPCDGSPMQRQQCVRAFEHMCACAQNTPRTHVHHA